MLALPIVRHYLQLISQLTVFNLMDLETQRIENLRQKQKLLADLNLKSEHIPRTNTQDRSQPNKKRRLNIESQPSRVSARIASSDVKPSYKEDSGDRYNFVELSTRPKKTKQTSQVELTTDIRNLTPAPDAEDIRAGWTRWKSTAKPPLRDDAGTFHFDDQPTFTPNKSPEEMIREGCFGGSYFRPLKSRKLGILIQHDWQELPREWHSGLDVSQYMTNPTYNPDINKFKVSCGQSIEEWEAAGWIAYEHDIRGWFQWYCRFFQGRRCDDDNRQVSRWRKCVGQTGRWRRMLLKKYLQMGVQEVFDDGEDDKEVSPVMHQTCFHWAYEVKQPDLEAAWAGR